MKWYNLEHKNNRKPVILVFLWRQKLLGKILQLTKFLPQTKEKENPQIRIVAIFKLKKII